MSKPIKKPKKKLPKKQSAPPMKKGLVVIPQEWLKAHSSYIQAHWDED
jgi:hypothetical protein